VRRRGALAAAHARRAVVGIRVVAVVAMVEAAVTGSTLDHKQFLPSGPD